MTAKRLMDRLEKTNGLDRKQYGFREAHTTMDAIDKVITQIKQNKTPTSIDAGFKKCFQLSMDPSHNRHAKTEKDPRVLS